MPRVPQAGVIGVMIKVSAPPFEYVVARQVRVRERRYGPVLQTRN